MSREEWCCECCDYATVRVDDLIAHMAQHGCPPAAVRSAERYSRVSRQATITVVYRIAGKAAFRWIGTEQQREGLR